jgi:uncharacterized protein
MANDRDRKIDYIEFTSTDIQSTKDFYTRVFNWKFEDYGPEYTSFADGRIAGGFQKGELKPGRGPLVVIYADDLADVQRRVKEAGGKIARETFSFPGGSRFHFLDPSGNELAVWSEA